MVWRSGLRVSRIHLHFLISHCLVQYLSTLRGIIDDLYIYKDNSTVLFFHYVLTNSSFQNFPRSLPTVSW